MGKNTNLSREQVLHIAKLANLTLTEKEVKKFKKDLSDILAYIDVLNELDTSKVKPTSQVTGLKNVFREDKESRCLSQEEALVGAKVKHQGYFKVKAIFE